MPTNAEDETQVDAQRPDIRASFARYPEDSEVSLLVELKEIGLVDGAYTKLPLDRGDERGSLEKGTSKSLNCAGEGSGIRESRVEAEYGDVLLPSTLLGLDKTSCSVDTNNETAGDLGVECSTVSSLFHTKDPSQPGDDFMGRWVGRLVQVYDTRPFSTRVSAFSRRQTQCVLDV